MRELFLLLGSEQIEVTCHPHAQLEVNDFFVLQARLFEEQLQHGFALLLHLFLFLAHNAVVFDDYGGKVKTKSWNLQILPKEKLPPQALGLRREWLCETGACPCVLRKNSRRQAWWLRAGAMG